MELRAIIVEDEETSREILKNYLAKYCPTVVLKGEAANVDEALVLIRNNELDRQFETVFVTAYNHYAIDALNAHASYYLLKPISIDKLIEAVDYVSEIIENENSLQNSVLRPIHQPVAGKITIPQQNGFEVLSISDILYCQADDNYTQIFLKEGKKLVSKTLKYFEDALADNGFARVHKSYLVNVSAVVEYRKGKGGSVVLSSGKQIMVSPAKKKALLAYFS